jgi:hypothetical protein
VARLLTLGNSPIFADILPPKAPSEDPNPALPKAALMPPPNEDVPPLRAAD